MSRRPLVAALVFAAAAAGCRRDPPPPAPEVEWFADATDRLKVNFVHAVGDPTDFLMPRVMGSGVAAFDADGDGRPDLLFLQNAGPGSGKTNQLFRQQPDGTFADASAGSGLDFDGFNMGVAVGDVNDDGRPDVAVTQYRGTRLLLNEGGGRFRDATAAAGIANPHWGTSAAFFDYDRDGRLDLVVANYVNVDPGHTCESTSTGKREFCGPSSFPGTPAKLFRNRGDGTFEDASLPSGIAKVPGPGLGVYCADLTGDGWPDVFVANDAKPNHLWVNQKDGTFKEEALARGLAVNAMGQAAANMGVAVGDVDGDGRTDLFVTHLTTESHTLWKQEAAGQFKDRTAATRAAATAWRGTGFGTVLADFDLDGRPDLALANGAIAAGPKRAEHLPAFWQPYAERNQLLRNDGGTFADVSEANPAFCGPPNVARGLTAADLDGDGRPDLVVTTVAGPARVLLNKTTANRPLAVSVLTKAGRPAHGAEVRVTAGGRTQLRTIQPADSYLSSGTAAALFGLGAADRFDEVVVRWPDGEEQRLPGGTDKSVEVRRP
jgi:hypothetical protein